jgi:electron-transferring-flavoprotein dehydrogenase
VQHSFGWPLDNKTGGGSFLYHLEDNQVMVGFVVHLNYKNPTLAPFEEFQRFKTHPAIAALSRAASAVLRRTRDHRRRLPVGAETVFPGGALIGCAAGFVNVPRIKGSHNAVLTGIMAAEAGRKALHRPAVSATSSPATNKAGAAPRSAQDLKKVRNVKPLWSKFGLYHRHDARRPRHVDQHAVRFFVLRHAEATARPMRSLAEPASKHQKIDYPKPDGVISFDKLGSVFISNTNHEENQPIHLKVKDMELQKKIGARCLCRPVEPLLSGRRL